MARSGPPKMDELCDLCEQRFNGRPRADRFYILCDAHFDKISTEHGLNSYKSINLTEDDM